MFMPRPKKNSPNPFGQLIKTSGQARAAEVPEVLSGGDKKGRRSREGYTQVGAYIPKALYKDVQRRLLDEERNFSELVEELLLAYLTKRQVS
jgi:hypothetical protein